MALRLLPFATLLLLAAGQETTEEASSEPKSKPADTGDGDKTRKELAEGKVYCEYDNCYELLGVKTDAGPIPSMRSRHGPLHGATAAVALCLALTSRVLVALLLSRRSQASIPPPRR